MESHCGPLQRAWTSAAFLRRAAENGLRCRSRGYWERLASLSAEASPSAQASRCETPAEAFPRNAQCPQPDEADRSPKKADSNQKLESIRALFGHQADGVSPTHGAGAHHGCWLKAAKTLGLDVPPTLFNQPLYSSMLATAALSASAHWLESFR